jgi:hypothetical protein
MWRDVASVSIPSGKYDLYSNLASKGHDTQAQMSFYSSIFTILIYLGMIGFSYVPFYFDYKNKVFENSIE